jgi:hypothetical protein
MLANQITADERSSQTNVAYGFMASEALCAARGEDFAERRVLGGCGGASGRRCRGLESTAPRGPRPCSTSSRSGVMSHRLAQLRAAGTTSEPRCRSSSCHQDRAIDELDHVLEALRPCPGVEQP